MRVTFFYEYGEKPEIGTGHKYRTKTIVDELEKRGHNTHIMSDGILLSNTDVLVVDHMFSQSGLIKRAKSANIKVVLIDGVEEDVPFVDESISAVYNKRSTHTGVDYMCFPTKGRTNFYSKPKSNSVFVGMGGFDCGNLAEFVVDTLSDFGFNAIVAKSINHNFHKPNMEFYIGDNYYDAMNECLFGITGCGLTLFQALFYGLPTIGLAQYDHQIENAKMVDECCLFSTKDALKNNIERMIKSEYLRTKLSIFGSHMVDGKAAIRISNIIEGLM